MGARVSLASVTKEFTKQPSLLRSLVQSSEWSGLRENGDPIVVGAGDSYAASVCASLIAGPRVAALDPYSLAESVAWAKNRPVYIISISGETKSNIELARALKGVATRTTAITSNATSRLARVVDNVIELPFRPPAKSPGIATFTLSLAVVLKVSGLDPACDFESAFSRGVDKSKRIKIASKPNTTYFAANNEAYGASIYGAAKIYELTGGRAQASLLEEFSHMPLFSLYASDTVNVIQSTGRKAERLNRGLEKAGFKSSLIHLTGGRIDGLFTLVFASQLAAIRAAKRVGLTVPHFLVEKKKLRISDEMIY